MKVSIIWLMLVVWLGMSLQAYAGLKEGKLAVADNDYAKAFNEFKTLADNGNAQAQYELGILYMFGLGVTENRMAAFNWYRKSAENGYAKAQQSIAIMYASGADVDKDDVKALEWHKKAAIQGDDLSACILGGIYNKGTGVAQDKKEAVRWYLKSVELGGFGGRCGAKSLAEMYEKGDGVAQDLLESNKWSSKAKEIEADTYRKSDARKKQEAADLEEYRAANRQAALLKKLPAYRAKLAVGDDTHCGMVIEIKRPIVKVQTVVGEKWFKVVQLFPKGEADCKFYNGRYIEPK